jgi:hypothetical protein
MSNEPTGPFYFYEANPILPDEAGQEKQIQNIIAMGFTREQAIETMKHALEAKLVKSSEYQVAIYDAGNGFGLPMIHLSIKRLDKQPIHDWRVLQQIKNALMGEEFEAIELYPAESRLVDSANQYHLWVIDDPAARFPIGFTTRLVDDQNSIGGSVQKPFKNRDAVLPSKAELIKAIDDAYDALQFVTDFYQREFESMPVAFQTADHIVGEAQKQIRKLRETIAKSRAS